MNIDFQSLKQSLLNLKSKKSLKRMSEYTPKQLRSGIQLNQIIQPQHYNITKMMQEQLVKCRQKLRQQYKYMRIQIFFSTVIFSILLIMILHLSGKLSDEDPNQKAYYLMVYLASSFLFASVLIFWMKRWTRQTFRIIKQGLQQINKQMRIKGVNAIKKIKNTLFSKLGDPFRTFCLVQVMQQVHSVQMTQ